MVVKNSFISLIQEHSPPGTNPQKGISTGKINDTISKKKLKQTAKHSYILSNIN